MKIFIIALLLSFSTFAKDVELAFGGDAYLSLQNWSNVGQQTDSKIGVGLGGDFGVGVKLDNMKLIVGPHLGYNHWSQNYSKNGATSSVYVATTDTGMVLMADMDDFILKLGAGTSKLSMGYTINGETYEYPIDRSFSYKSVSVGFNLRPVIFSIGVTNYSELKSANRGEFSIGIGF